MAIDLTGINNDNEFYTHHYLSAILEGDLREQFSKWAVMEKEQDIKSPYSALKSLSTPYFKIREKLEKEKILSGRLDIQRSFLKQILDVLGYEYHPCLKKLDESGFIPIMGEVSKKSGAPELWILEGLKIVGDDVSPLELTLVKEQYQKAAGYDEAEDYLESEKAKTVFESTIEDLVSKSIFGLEEPPRWIILISMTRIILLDRTKWNEKRVLRFDLDEIFGRKEMSTLKAVSALLARECICPSDGLSLLDTLDENSHKNAFAVSEDLKYALHQSIELLGNEAIHYISSEQKKGIYGKDMADELTLECLRFMYRLLFMFYIEARPELGYVPMKSDAYRKGYSVESLRDLEMVKLTTDESKNGYYIHHSLSKLFEMIYNGLSFKDQELSFGSDKPLRHLFELSPLDAHLFDPERTKILNKIKFRNSVLQKIIKLMSLTRPSTGRQSRRGRISYAQLGINQLGAVYEALLSYKGFFAETELYEVKKAGDSYNELETAFFVKAEELEKYTEDEKVYNADGTLKKYPKGSFVYRLAGRDREKSASYYTPEVLTKCLVKYSLKELLKDKTADDILSLTVCEPAMGSAAFLNEAINQLAENYLRLKQKETGINIPHDTYTDELQKVKLYLGDNNVFGVDLNPVAVELAEVSLWLNTIHDSGFVPWYGMQLECGNSLIGARRQVFVSSLLKKKVKTDSLWLDNIPVRVIPGDKRKKNSVYHFLLPDKGMAAYTDKVVRSISGEKINEINAWRRDFIKPFSTSDISILEQLSDAVDKLWNNHTKELQMIRRRTTDPFYVFGQEVPKKKQKPTTTREKDKIHMQELHSVNVRHSSEFRRLKLVMDYWCSLWFWPIEQADLLPSREEYLFELSLILEGNLFEQTPETGEQMSLFPDTRPTQQYLDLVDKLGYVNIDKLCENNERLSLVKALGENYRFFHWELVFADVFDERGGFDLILGNPPWLKVEWKEAGIMGDKEPLFVLRKFSASKLGALREETLNKYQLRSSYLSEFEGADGTQNFLNAKQNYYLLEGMKANLYKCFLPQAWMIGGKQSVSGFLHPEGIYDDPKGGKLRDAVFPRLKAHFQFQNELSLFAEVDHHTKFSVNIYGEQNDSISFSHIANLYAPQTIYTCFEHSGSGSVGGIKDDNNKWNVQGHKDRIIYIGKGELELFATLYDTEGTPSTQARLPALHAQILIDVIKKFAHHPTKLGDLQGKYVSTQHWNEVNSQADGTIRRETIFSAKPENLILSGPHFYVGNPCNKTPREVCSQNSQYDVIDLTELPDDYLPRTNYVPDCDRNEYINRTPFVPWNESKVTKYYRIVFRAMISPPDARTLISSIIPPQIAHTNGSRSYIFKPNLIDDAICFSAFSFSIPFDFFTKSTGRKNLHNMLDDYPFLVKSKYSNSLILRALLLNCVNNYYNELWGKCWTENFKKDRWTNNDNRLSDNLLKNLTQEWNRNVALRTDYERRQALVEIDVLASMALGLTLDELKTIYRIQFPVMRQYESDTWYDQKGRIVFTINRGLPGVGFTRPEWNQIKEMKEGTVERTIMDDTLPGGPRERTITYYAPFDRCDREADYETAWAAFEERNPET